MTFSGMRIFNVAHIALLAFVVLVLTFSRVWGGDAAETSRHWATAAGVLCAASFATDGARAFVLSSWVGLLDGRLTRGLRLVSALTFLTAVACIVLLLVMAVSA